MELTVVTGTRPRPSLCSTNLEYTLIYREKIHMCLRRDRRIPMNLPVLVYMDLRKSWTWYGVEILITAYENR